jgi:hypothetical protein
MPSAALAYWRGQRAKRLDDLLSAHGTIAGPGPGRKWRTEQINWSLIVRLAAEFQGFCVDLHTLGAEAFAERAAPGNLAAQRIIRNTLTLGRDLDRKNASGETVRNDFRRFGVNWPTSLQSRDPYTPVRWGHMGRLNRARNAIVHDDVAKIEELRREGFPLILGTFKKWRLALDALAGTMDEELAETLARLFGIPNPW